MKLSFSPASPFARKVRIAAIELGLIDKIEFITATVVPGQPNDEYSRITPLKKLPVLILDNGDVILDSYVIVEYLDELAGGGKLIPASGAARWKVKSDHSMLQGMLDSMLLCRYEKMVRPEPLRWQAWADDHWARAWNGMARFEKQAEMLARPQLDIAQIGLVCVLGYADFRFADCGWRKAFPKLDAFHAENAGTAVGQDLGAAAGVTGRSCHEPQIYRRRSHHPSPDRAGNQLPAGAGDAARADAGACWRKTGHGCSRPARSTRSDVLILCFQSYVVKTPHHTILIDSCIGNDKPRPLRPKWNMKTDDTYLRALAAAGFAVGDIDFVMCTHLHVDHVGWNTRLENGRWVPTFPNARYVFGKSEFDYWTEQNANDAGAAVRRQRAAGGRSRKGRDRARRLRDRRSRRGSCRRRATPRDMSRSPSAAARTTRYSRGDLMHSPLQTRYPELSVKFDVDQAVAAATRRGFLERYCDTDTLCCTAHFPSPSTGKIRRLGNGFSCEAVRLTCRSNLHARDERSVPPLPSGEVASTCERVRGYGLSMGRNPSPGATRRPLPKGEVWHRAC